MAIDRTYTVKWYGPFSSVEEVQQFEQQYANLNFQLYLLQGKKKCAKSIENYYCGQTTRNVSKRLSNEHRVIHELPRLTAIWIGTISNIETPTKEDLNAVEKIITAQMYAILGDKFLLNQTNTKFPTYNAYIINTWHDLKGERRQKYKKLSMPDIIPDLIDHEFIKEEYIQYSKIYSAPKIKWTNMELK